MQLPEDVKILGGRRRREASRSSSRRLKGERINRADWRLIRRLHRRPRFSVRCNFFAVSALCACLFGIFGFSDSSSTLHQSLFLSLSLSLSCRPSWYQILHTYLHICTESMKHSSSVSTLVVCKIVVETRMLDGNRCAGQKQEKSHRDCFIFETWCRSSVTLDTARYISSSLAFVSSVTVVCISNMERTTAAG